MERCEDRCEEVRPMTEVELLKMENAELKKALEETKKEKDMWYRQYNEYLEQAVKYRHAFKAVMEELTKK